jgi:hypothetical protein
MVLLDSSVKTSYKREGVSSYVFLTASVFFKEQWGFTELVFPVFKGIFGNGFVALVAYLKGNRGRRVV